MSRFSWHKRNHSFPPALKHVQSSSRILAPPLPDIDDEPWMHFLSPLEDEEDSDYLHFDAGILVGTETPKKKSQKFRPHRSGNILHHHHGSFSRASESHGWIEHKNASSWTRTQGMDIPVGSSQHARRRSRRTLSGHRHSWQEPSLDTLEEELPQIIVSDYDAVKAPRQRSDSVVDPDTELADKGSISPESDTSFKSPHLGAAHPQDKPDADLNQMWFAERARL